MKTYKLYYTPPTQEIFDEVKEKSIDIWITYDDTYGYASEKVDRIKDLKNMQDNVMYIVAMFDYINQAKLAVSLSDEAREAISERMKSGGMPDSYNAFIL